jgi:hypothetical protein
MSRRTVTVFFLHGEGPRSRCYGRTTALRLFVQPCDEDKDEQFFYQVLQVMEHQWNEIDRGKPTTERKTCPSAALSTTNPTWTYPGLNLGLRSERPANNHLSHGTAMSRRMWTWWDNSTAKACLPSRIATSYTVRSVANFNILNTTCWEHMATQTRQARCLLCTRLLYFLFLKDRNRLLPVLLVSRTRDKKTLLYFCGVFLNQESVEIGIFSKSGICSIECL